MMGPPNEEDAYYNNRGNNFVGSKGGYYNEPPLRHGDDRYDEHG